MRKQRGIATFLNAASYEHTAKGIGLGGLKATFNDGKLQRKTKGPVSWDDGIIDPATGEKFDDPWTEWENGLADFKRMYPADEDAMVIDKRGLSSLTTREVTKSASGNQCDPNLHCEDLLCASSDGKTCARDFFAPCPCKPTYDDSNGGSVVSLPSGADQALSSAIRAVFSPTSKSGNKCNGPATSDTAQASPSFLINSMKETSFSTADVPETVTVSGSGLVATSMATAPSQPMMSSAAGGASACDDS